MVEASVSFRSTSYEVADLTINTETELTIQGTIARISEIPKDATLEIGFNTQ